MLHCVSRAADSEAFIFHRSCAVIRGGFKMSEPAVNLPLESFCIQRVDGQKFYKLNADKR